MGVRASNDLARVVYVQGVAGRSPRPSSDPGTLRHTNVLHPVSAIVQKGMHLPAGGMRIANNLVRVVYIVGIAVSTPRVPRSFNPLVLS
jgi:hypothetical protein